MLSWDEFDKEEGGTVASTMRTMSSIRRGDLYASAIRRTRDLIWRRYRSQHIRIGGDDVAVAYWVSRSIDPLSVHDLFILLKGQIDRFKFELCMSTLDAFAKVVIALWLQSLRTTLTTPFSPYDAELSVRRHRLRIFS